MSSEPAAPCVGMATHSILSFETSVGERLTKGALLAAKDFSDGASGREPACHCRRRHKRLRLDPWVRKIPRRRNWQPTPVFLPGKSMDRGAWQVTIHGVTKELDTTEQLSTYTCLAAKAKGQRPDDGPVSRGGLWTLTWQSGQCPYYITQTILLAALGGSLPLGTPKQEKKPAYTVSCSWQHQRVVSRVVNSEWQGI